MTPAPASDLKFSQSARPVLGAGFLPPSRACATTFLDFFGGAALRDDLAMRREFLWCRLNESSGPYASRARVVSASHDEKTARGTDSNESVPPGCNAGERAISRAC